MTTFHVTLYGGGACPSLSELLSVFSWRVWRVATLAEAITNTIQETGDPERWQWAFVKWPASKRLGVGVRVHAYRLGCNYVQS